MIVVGIRFPLSDQNHPDDRRLVVLAGMKYLQLICRMTVEF